jgi:pimeloyl-ACP methyl ester carboxylesterase
LIEMEDGVSIDVQDLGTGPALALISGFGLDHQLWDRQVRVLTGAGFRVLCITQRGHGHSDHPLDGYGIDRLAADVVAVLERSAITSATLVGHSFGGQVAFHAAAAAPQLIAKLALVGSNAVRATRSDSFPFGGPPESTLATVLHNEIDDRFSARYHLIESTFAGEPDPRLVDWLARTWLKMPSWSAVACYRTMMTADLIAEIPAVRQPVLQINSTADPVHSAKGSRWLNARLRDATLVELDCGHFPMLELPNEFDEALLAFHRTA